MTFTSAEGFDYSRIAEKERPQIDDVLSNYAPQLGEQTLAVIDGGRKKLFFAKSRNVYGAIFKVGDNLYFDLDSPRNFKYVRSKRLYGNYRVVPLDSGSTVSIALRTPEDKVTKVHGSPASHWVVLQRSEPLNYRDSIPLIYFYRGPQK